MRFFAALLSQIAAVSMNAALAADESKVAEPVTVQATTLHSVFIENAPGLPGSTFPVRMRDKSGCEWILSVTLDSMAQRLMGRVESKQCDSIRQQVSGYLVGADDLSGLAVECYDIWQNKAGSIMCLSARVAEGIPGRLVLQTN